MHLFSPARDTWYLRKNQQFGRKLAKARAEHKAKLDRELRRMELGYEPEPEEHDDDL